MVIDVGLITTGGVFSSANAGEIGGTRSKVIRENPIMNRNFEQFVKKYQRLI